MTKSQTSLRKPFLTRDASNEIESCTRVMDVFKDFSNVLKIRQDELRFDGTRCLSFKSLKPAYSILETSKVADSSDRSG